MVGSDVSNWLRNYTWSWSLLESFHVSSQESLQPTGHRFLSTRFVLILCAYCATDGTFNDDEPVVARGSFHTTNPIPFPKFQGNAFISTRKKRKEKSNAFIFPMKVFILKALRERGRASVPDPRVIALPTGHSLGVKSLSQTLSRSYPL